MRISISFRPVSLSLTLPIHYNYLVQSFIYRSLGNEIANFYHTEGFSYGKRRFKLFTFSRLFSAKRRILSRSREIVFEGKVCLKIGAMDEDLLESLATHLVRRGSFYLGRNLCELEAVEVEMPVDFKGPLVVKALSPITIHETLTTAEGRKRTHYYTPFEADFSDKILENLVRKAKAYYGEEVPSLTNGNSYVKPLRISRRDEVIVNFKRTWIKGWLGIYELNFPRLYLELAYTTGLGARNSQGFGMVEIAENFSFHQVKSSKR